MLIGAPYPVSGITSQFSCSKTRGVMTLNDYGYLPPGFLKSYPVSEQNFQIYTLPRSLAFFRGFFWGIYCYANFLCHANFSIVFYCFQTNCFLGGGANSRGKLLEGKASSQPNNVSKHRKELFSKETLTNSCTVCHIITINMLKTSKTGINFLNKRQIS